MTGTLRGHVTGTLRGHVTDTLRGHVTGALRGSCDWYTKQLRILVCMLPVHSVAMGLADVIVLQSIYSLIM